MITHQHSVRSICFLFNQPDCISEGEVIYSQWYQAPFPEAHPQRLEWTVGKEREKTQQAMIVWCLEKKIEEQYCD